jgi:hypothetical protein
MQTIAARAGATVGAVFGLGASSTQTAQARVAPPPPPSNATAAGPSSSALGGGAAAADDAAQPKISDDWDLVVPATAVVPVFPPSEIDAAKDIAHEHAALAVGAGGEGAAAAAPSSAGGGSVDSEEGDAADLVLAATQPSSPLNALLNGATTMLGNNPVLQAHIAAGIARDPELVALMERCVAGGAGAAAPLLLSPQHLPLLPASAASDEGEEEDTMSEEEAERRAALMLAREPKAAAEGHHRSRDHYDYDALDPLATLAHGFARLGAWLRAKVVDPLLGLADEDEQEEQEAKRVVASAVDAAGRPHQRPATASTAADDGVKDAADAWLGALTAAMIAIVMIAILRRPAVAREFVRAAMRGAAAASAARR